VGQIPIYHDHESTGRPPRKGGEILSDSSLQLAGPNNTDDYYTSKFLDLPLGPRYDFGTGLSYTSFALSGLTLSSTTLTGPDAGLEVTVDVQNTGERAGDDVLMLFVTDEVASLTQPVRRLRGFERVTLRPGEHSRTSFTLAIDDLRFWTDDDRHIVEDGDFTLSVEDGTSQVSARFALEGVNR
jgi:beta-glucosidase